MKLLQLCAGQIRLNEPLPWNVRNAPGELLLSKGFVITTERQLESLLERGVYVDETDYERHRRESAAGTTDGPFDTWSETARKIGALLRTPGANFSTQLQTLSTQVHELSTQDPDIAGFALLHMDRVGYPVLHCIHTAYLAVLVGQRIGMVPNDCRTAVHAALTMNLSMLDLQSKLCAQAEPLSEEQRQAVHSHPLRSRTMLEHQGVADAAWLDAVEQHHERSGGSGYPRGINEVAAIAAVLHHADIYLAKLASRRSRPALRADEAARRLFTQHSGSHNPIVAAIIKEMGIYPAGTYVKLANGETAVVVRRGESANTPHVYSLTNAQGIAFAEPLKRDTKLDRFKVATPVASANVMVRFDRRRLFGVAS